MSNKDDWSTTTFTTPNHPHAFRVFVGQSEWRCDGESVFDSGCKTSSEIFGAGFGIKHYKCTVCTNFDFCEKCLAPMTAQKSKQEN